MRMFLRPALGLFALCFTATIANADLVTFTTDTLGNKPNGFQSTTSSNVTFTDSLGADLVVGNWTESNNSNALAIFGDDTSKLIMNFSGYYTDLSLDFGNDHPGVALNGDAAYLQLFDGATLVNTVSLVMNIDDLMNQTISYSGAAFNRAEFYYGRPSNNDAPIGLIEVVDNIQFSAVPVPSGVILAGIGVAGAFGLRRRFQKSIAA